MKKALSVLLTACLILSAFLIVPTAVGADDIKTHIGDVNLDGVVDNHDTILGDADGDGKVTILDATAIQRCLAGLTTKSFFKKAADADGDGDVTILDATAIQRWLAELETCTGIGKPIGGASTPDETDDEFPYLKDKPVCPECGSVNVAYILYGEPIPEEYYSDAFREKLENEEIIFGGCCIDECSPAWHCNDCGADIGGCLPDYEKEDFSYLENKPLCPDCGSEDVGYIMYGYPLPDDAYSDAFKEKVANGEIVWGGCVLAEYNPTWHCNSCGSDFG